MNKETKKVTHHHNGTNSPTPICVLFISNDYYGQDDFFSLLPCKSYETYDTQPLIHD